MLELSELTVIIIRVFSSSVVFSPTIEYLLEEVTLLVFLSSMIWRILHKLHCQHSSSQAIESKCVCTFFDIRWNWHVRYLIIITGSLEHAILVKI